MNLHSKILCADAITVNIMSDSITFVQKKSKPGKCFILHISAELVCSAEYLKNT